MKNLKEIFCLFLFLTSLFFIHLGFYKGDFRLAYLGFSLLFINFVYLMKKYIRDNDIVKAEYDAEKEIMYITRRNRSSETYSGSGTIWYSMPEFERTNTSMDLELSRLLDYNKKFGTYKKPL